MSGSDSPRLESVFCLRQQHLPPINEPCAFSYWLVQCCCRAASTLRLRLRSLKQVIQFYFGFLCCVSFSILCLCGFIGLSLPPLFTRADLTNPPVNLLFCGQRLAAHSSCRVANALAVSIREASSN
ncbi:Transposase [Fusarium oxysporum f. sp. albedinis]|nr:Transposase [Fusarium oxysporum f. sp. albedinis]